MPFSKALFIALEGIDGAGKSTLAKKLASWFESHDQAVHLTAEPTKNYLGKHIREILACEREGSEQTIAALFLADRIDHLTNPEYGMLGHLERKTTVLCDRYYLSSYAYHVPHVSLQWVIDANSVCADLRRPDLIFYIDITVEESLKRLQAGRENLDKYENEDRITLVRNNYMDAIEKVKNDEHIIIIDGHRPIEMIVEELIYHIENFVK